MKKLIIILFLTFTTTVVVEAANAQSFGSIVAQSTGTSAEQRTFGTYICKLRTCFLTNRLLLTVATIAVSILAIMVMFGKANWTMVLVTVTGVAIITGAYAILDTSGVIANPLPTLGISYTGGGSAVTLSTQDPCAAVGCFDKTGIVRNLLNP